MSNLVLTPNGRIKRKNRAAFDEFPNLGTFLTDIWSEDTPSVFRSNFNQGMTLPKVNIKESPESFEVHMAVPGFKKEDFNLSIENEELLISAEIEENKEETNDEFTRKEFGYASFRRSFILPETVDGEKIKANYQDGILNVTLPKKEEAKPKPARTIEIS
ncbi:MAG: Hsp20/alpha crystallin family protein [Lutimonas sp.]